jgi:hypothetical protein
MPFQSKNTTDITLIFDRLSRAFFFFVRGDPFVKSSPCAWLCNRNVSVKCLPSLQQNFTHTPCSSSFFIVTLSQIRRTACVHVQFSRCSSTINAHSETEQMTGCCQNLRLGALSSRITLSLLVGALFKKICLFFNSLVCVCVCVCIYICFFSLRIYFHRPSAYLYQKVVHGFHS